MTYHIAWCHDCSFRKVRRDRTNAKNLVRSHEGDSGHVVMLKGPLYEARGNALFKCSICGSHHPDPERVREHIKTRHDTVSHFVEKTPKPVPGGDDDTNISMLDGDEP